MLNKNFIKKIKKDFLNSTAERRQIISLSNMILHDSKRIIFSLHRGDQEKAKEELFKIEKKLLKMEEKFGVTRLYEEGAFKAGVEEYVEAKTFFLVLTGKKISTIKAIKLNYESYLGGICDLTGELVRRAINLAAAGKYQEVHIIKQTINDIMAELVMFDFTGYLRTKYDQAKFNLKKIEQISYEVKLRAK